MKFIFPRVLTLIDTFPLFSNAAENLHYDFITKAFTAQSSPKDGFLRYFAESGQSPTKGPEVRAEKLDAFFFARLDIG